MQIEIKFDDRIVKKKLNKLKIGLRSYKRPLNNIGKELLKKYREENFETQGDWLGERWKSLSPATLMARKKRIGYYKKTPLKTNKILIWTGNLQSGFRKKVKRFRLEIFNKVKYFKYHQKLGKVKRRMLGINREVIEIVETKLVDYIKKLIR